MLTLPRFALSVLLVAGLLTLASVVAFPLSPAAAEDPPRFVFGGAEITRHWNDTHNPNISLTTGRQAAHYLNGLVVAYLRAMAIPHEANWDRVARCESGGDWHINTGNGYLGGLQWLQSTFEAYGGTGRADLQSKREQIQVAERVRTTSGLHHWPTCGGLWY